MHNITLLPRTALRSKVDNCLERYLSLSCEQKLSIGLYHSGQCYRIDFGNDDSRLFYDIGSISKTLTAQLILKIFSEEQADIHRPVSDFLSLKDGNYPTVYALLTHTAGYSHLTPLEITLPSLLRHRYSHRNPYENATEKAVIRALERRNHAKSGHAYGYSDFAYAILAIIAEKLKEKPFHDLLTDFLAHDLSMHRTTITRQAASPKAVHNGKVIPYWTWEKNNPYLAAGGVTSNLEDMLTYIEAQIQREDDYITKAHTVCPASFKDNTRIGTRIGWHTYKKSNQCWHVGGVGTFRSSIIINRKRRLGVVVLGNTKGIKSANVHYIAKMLYSEMKMHRIHMEIG